MEVHVPSHMAFVVFEIPREQSSVTCGSRIFGPRCHTTTYALHASQPDPLRCRLTEAKLRQLDEFDTADPRLPPRVHPPPNGLGRRKLGTASATRGPSTLGDQSFPDEETGSSLIVHLARYGTPHQATSGVPPEQQAAVDSFCLCPQYAGAAAVILRAASLHRGHHRFSTSSARTPRCPRPVRVLKSLSAGACHAPELDGAGSCATFRP
jgi:hypothetical protein